MIKHTDNSLTAINVTYTDDIPEREIRALSSFQDVFSENIRRRILITKDIEKEKEGLEYIPLWRWLLGRYRDIGDLMDRKRKNKEVRNFT